MKIITRTQKPILKWHKPTLVA